MIELDGIEYQVKTPTENAYDMITFINNYCEEKGIVNSKGEQIYIDINPMNPLFLIIFGAGYLFSIIQKLLYSIGCSLSVSASSPRQLLDLATNAGIRRREPTKTTISAMIYAMDSGPCIITESLSATITLGGISVVFHPAFDYTIPANSSTNMILVADIPGSFNISANTIQGFDTIVGNLRLMTTAESIPGQDMESIASLRQRIQRRMQSGTQLDKAMDAITALPGVSMCNIYFNYSPLQDIIVGGITIPPRKAALIVQGYNDKIAETFYSYVLCESCEGPTDRTFSQMFTTHSGQEIPVYVIQPRQLPVYIRLYVSASISDAVATTVRDTITSLSSNLIIGQTLSVSDIVEVLRDLDIGLLGVTLSTDNIQFSYKAKPDSDQVITFNSDNINIILGE